MSQSLVVRQGINHSSAGSRAMAEASYSYRYPRPAVTVDAVVFSLRPGGLSVLLIERRKDPFKGRQALPGGFLEMDEPAEVGARRELREETGVTIESPFRPLGFYDSPGRDPRGRTISLAFLALTDPRAAEPRGRDDAANAAWRGARGLAASELAFDHAAILADALTMLEALADPGDAWLELLGPRPDRESLKALFRELGRDGRAAEPWLRRRSLDAKPSTRRIGKPSRPR